MPTAAEIQLGRFVNGAKPTILVMFSPSPLAMAIFHKPNLEIYKLKVVTN
jgi:hypothetical protein